MKASYRTSVVRVATQLYNNLRAEALKKLRKYCTDRVVELGLTTKAFQYEFYLGINSVESRKTIGRLKTLLNKHISKFIPYTAFVINEFIQVSDRERLNVNIGTRDWLTGFSYMQKKWIDTYGYGEELSSYDIANSSNAKECALESYHECRLMSRYAKYLTFLCIKYGLPVKVTYNRSLYFHEEDFIEASNKTHSERKAFDIRYRLNQSLNFSLVRWTHRQVDVYQREIDRFNRNLGYPSDFFSNERNWTGNGFIGSSRTVSSIFHRYCPEKIFYYLDRVIKVFVTLTRKANYGSSAFSFRNSSNS